MPANRAPIMPLSLSGADGNGTTDDTAKIAAFVAAVSAAYGHADFLVDKRYYVPGGFPIFSYQKFHGTRGGALLGDPAYVTAVTPIPTTKIYAYGTANLAGAVNYGTTIAAGTNAFTVSNSFAVDQYALVRNYPTDTGSGPTDAYTITGGQAVYGHGSISAGGGQTVDAANKRQWRRVEPARIRTASSSAITLYAPVAYDYTYTAGMQFVPYAPVKAIAFEDVYMQDIFLDLQLADRFTWTGGRLYRSTVSVARSLNSGVYQPDFDAANTDNCINFGRSSRFFEVLGGRYVGGQISSDNALIRVDQASNFTIIVTGSAHRSGVVLCLIDCNYFEDPGMADGLGQFPDVPVRNFYVNINDCGENISCFLTTNRFAAGIDNFILDVIAGGTVAPAVYLKGCFNGIARLSIPYGGLRVDGCTGLKLDGNWASYYAPGPGGNGALSDPIGVGADILNSLTRSSYATYP